MGPGVSGGPTAAAVVAASEGKAKKYGLLGLLGVIRMTDPDLNMLALGSDLTTVGLNLDSADVSGENAPLVCVIEQGNGSLLCGYMIEFSQLLHVQYVHPLVRWLPDLFLCWETSFAVDCILACAVSHPVAAKRPRPPSQLESPREVSFEAQRAVRSRMSRACWRTAAVPVQQSSFFSLIGCGFRWGRLCRAN